MNRHFAIFCFVVSWPIYALAGILHVPEDQPTIQAGINAAVNGDTVLVADSTYYENINFKGKAITIASMFIMNGDTNHINNTIIDGNQPSHPDSGSVVLFVSGEDTSSVLCGFTITGGSGTYIPQSPLYPEFRMGGGILVVFAGAKICHNIIKNNSIANAQSVMGGGLVNGPPDSTGFVIVENNVFDSNSCTGSELASQGGGLQLSGRFKLCNNIIRNNFVSSTYGEAFGGGFAGILNLDSALVYNNVFINNRAETLYGTGPLDAALGAGLVIWNDTTAFIRVIGNIVAYNELISSHASTGAGILIEDVAGDVIIANNLIYGNYYNGTVSCYGTGLSVHDHTIVSIINNTVTGNEASPHGGSLSIVDSTYTTSVLAMNNIFWGNSAGGSMPEINIWAGYLPKITYCDVQGSWPGEGNISTDPMMRGKYFELSDSSRCLGAGTISYQFGSTTITCPDTCFLGHPRPSPPGSNPDMGACESALDSPLVGLRTPFLNNLQKCFNLKQNYPNPFNPSTTIEFNLPKTGEVRLKIFNIIGEEVAILVSDRLNTGKYKYDWDASGLASGVYLCGLETRNHREVRKMILMK